MERPQQPGTGDGSVVADARLHGDEQQAEGGGVRRQSEQVVGRLAKRPAVELEH